ncbi:response regulator transcription factor [Pseudoxanthomonas sp. UTMC 1351]|uniref:response regulator transcription factor n=1 Tax=Pseudoxanthomonas sp. UTMC 1351 TaxID=2695853 RepID=UPI0034CF24E6
MAAPSGVIHVVDDDSSVRDALHRLLSALGFEVRLYASAGDYLLAWSGDSPGCLLLDVRMPGPSGLDLQLALMRRPDALPVVFITGFGNIPMSVLAIRRGAVDFLTKPIDRDALISAVTTAIERDANRRESELMKQHIRRNFSSLTPRERSVFEQVVAGRLNKQIAASLSTCERTVKAHRAHVMEKFNVHSVAQLVHLAVQLELDTASRSESSAVGEEKTAA